MMYKTAKTLFGASLISTLSFAKFAFFDSTNESDHLMTQEYFVHLQNKDLQGNADEDLKDTYLTMLASYVDSNHELKLHFDLRENVPRQPFESQTSMIFNFNFDLDNLGSNV